MSNVEDGEAAATRERPPESPDGAAISGSGDVDARAAATEALRAADVIEDQTPSPVQDLMVQAYVDGDEIPDRIINPAGGDAPTPDLTETDAGREFLRGLDDFVAERIGQQEPQHEGKPRPDPLP